MNKIKKAVAAGHICIDITPIFPTGKTERTEAILSPGRLVEMAGADIHTGGSVANTGLAMKILGADVTLMGKVGDDELGRLTLDCLRKYDAGAGIVRSSDADTSFSVVLAIPGMDRIFLHQPGANDTFGYEDLDWEVIREASLFHFGYPTLMKRMYRDQGKELVRILKKVKELGTAVSLDMAAVDEASEAAQAGWDQILSRVLPFVDFFVPSVGELCFMLDRGRYDSWAERADGRELTEVPALEELQKLGETVLKYGAKVVLIKCGAAGMYYKTSSRETMRSLCEDMKLSLPEWADREGFETSYVPDAVLSGTGAGDSSIAAFLASVLEEAPLEKAVRMAAATGASCVAAYDALSGIRPLELLQEKIDRGWERRKQVIGTEKEQGEKADAGKLE